VKIIRYDMLRLVINGICGVQYFQYFSLFHRVATSAGLLLTTRNLSNLSSTSLNLCLYKVHFNKQLLSY
jgi:hypothetical protein